MMQSRVALESFDGRQHEALLKNWLLAPHVAQWWKHPERHLAIALKPPSSHQQAIITVDEQAVGYVYWQRASANSLAKARLNHIPAGSIAVSLLIGEAPRLGQRIGPRALRLLLGELRRDPSIPLVKGAVPAHHTAAIRAYEKAGFVRSHPYTPPDPRPYLLMVVDLQRRDEDVPKTIMP
ncbi:MULTISPECIES: GNAT family N-acetyltransferase [unclassified Leptolyngbya]|uniref:GNAT family N-acetyltransferase n=1 Tax=unclassified Leptolyngbya TaxID=2650499 RepID=UPI00168766D6|nr:MULTISPECIES: GNAT family N-acetyltransferase [unclassified Leptolyngbya]MBD1912494.1 GNAT family N-acetyltransferase [Leptolyngbya sp. FACHB-8]MBD2156495.1 GNAT family N-acetyltransferase [Leptolyngbya sp. FACHB-16]